MNKTILEIKAKIKRECYEAGHMKPWFYDKHLLGVEKWAKFLLTKLPRADKEVVFLGVWLHDLHRIRGLKGDHQKAGAQEAKKVMQGYGYPDETIKKVQAIILTHACDGAMPKTLEGRILASADAMAHYINDFYLQIAVTGQRSVAEYKEWCLEKLKRDYSKKISFPFARQAIKDRHDALMKVFTMK